MFKKEKNFIVLILILILIIFQKTNFSKILSHKNKKRVCVINLKNLQNVGNILVKFAFYKKLLELGFNATIVASVSSPSVNIAFLRRTTNLIVIKNSFSELHEKDYDYVVLNSDQTWGYFNKKYFYDIAFLSFAKNWKIPKFIYGASIAYDKWFYTKEEERTARALLKNFTGISFREKDLVKLAKIHLNVDGVFVLDPTLIIDKKYYLNEIKNYNPNFNSDEKFIFIYQLDKNRIIEKVIKEASKKFNYKIYRHNIKKGDYIESFIFGISNCQAVITDSFHGTAFSINFNKPFLSFINRLRGKARFDSLKEIFNLGNRIVDPINDKIININLLKEPLNLNYTLFSELKDFSLSYLIKNLTL